MSTSSPTIVTAFDNQSKDNDSKRRHRVALCQFPVTSDKTTNHKTCAQYIRQAAQDEGAQLVVLPEIWNSPYATSAFGDYAESLSLDDDNNDFSPTLSPSAHLLQQLARQYSIWIVGGSVPEIDKDGNLYNTCLVFNPQGQVVAKHRKVHLFDIDVPNGITFRESDTLSAGNSMTAFDADSFGMVGVGICYDIRFPEYALVLGKKHQCKILIYPGAFNMTTGPAHWELLQRARAVDNQCFVLTASPARSLPPDNDADTNTNKKYPHYTAWGHSTIVSPWGSIVATCQEDPSIVVADLDLNQVDEIRQSIPIGNQKRTDLYTLKET